MGYRVGIDIGGTFTDFALLNGAEVILHKNLSTPEDRSIGVMTGLKRLAEKEGLALADFLAQCDAIVHGTTVADNTLIEMNGALTGLITTEGFRDEIEYRRGYKENIWDVRLDPPREITPRRRRLTVPERILADGSVYKPLDEAAVRAVCRRKCRACRSRCRTKCCRARPSTTAPARPWSMPTSRRGSTTIWKDWSSASNGGATASASW
jgi:N-methylhydantoinase A